MVRQIVLNQLILTGQVDVLEKAKVVYQEHQSDIAQLPAAIRRFVLINKIKYFEDEVAVDHLFDTYIHTNNNNIRLDIAAALSKTHQDLTLRRIQASMKDKAIVKPQDLAMWYSALLSQPFTQEKYGNGLVKIGNGLKRPWVAI